MKNDWGSYALVLGIYAVVGGTIYYLFPGFANSNFYFATITFLVGGYAFYVYAKQRRDEKINAATSLLLEIRNAESKVDILIDKLDKGVTTDLPSILPVNNWQNYSHLFAKDFDPDELQLLNNFFSACMIIEDLVHRQNNFVWITTEERAKTVQQLLARIHDDFQIEAKIDGAAAQAKFDARKRALGEFYSNEALSYAPNKILAGLKFQTQNIEKITTTPCGSKLKKMAQL